MTTNKNTDSSSQGDGGGAPPPPPPQGGQPENPRSRSGNTIFKSGPLFISSKGIGWTSWKKRWFILTRTSLVFFRSDPSAITQKGSEVNLTLGGIDLNNSGSVVVKTDKKLLTVLFPDGRDGRAFTLKAETLEDLNEWKTALENALAQAPSAALVIGQNGIFRNDRVDGADFPSEHLKDKQAAKSLVIGRPILLALEDVDGSPSFLEKALRYIEEHGNKVEGILRQAADVDDVEHRIREYEQGKMEFSSEEDAHVIADCVKYFIRELPSSPVPASCCNALLEACRTDRAGRVNAMRAAICETFPEPNRHLLQRILRMMKNVASHKAENRMSTSAVAACMAPLLLRTLLSGDCEIETDFNVGGDGSIQLLQAAAAANHAQAIVTTLLEEYDNIFREGSMTHDGDGLYSDSEECESEDEEVTDDDDSYDDDEHDDGTQESDAYTDDDLDNASNGTCIESGDSGENNISNNKGCNDCSSGSKSPEEDSDSKVQQKLSPSLIEMSLPLHDEIERSTKRLDQSNNNLRTQTNEYGELVGNGFKEATSENKLTGCNQPACIGKSTSLSNGPAHGTRRPTVWGRTSARKNLSMESIDYTFEDEVEIKNLEACKIDLKNRISEQAKSNAILQANLVQRKKALHDRRQALEQDVIRLQEQLQKERDKRIVLESALNKSQGPLPVTLVDEKMKDELEEIIQAEADVTNLKQKVDDLNVQLNQQRHQNYGSTHYSGNQPIHTSNHQAKRKDKHQDTEAEASYLPGRSAKKDAYMDKTERENEKCHESTSSPNKHPPQNQQSGPGSSSNSRSTNSKRSSHRSEGINSTSSALSKLTTRLNFLKERRTQMELQNMDKGQGSNEATTAPDKGRGSEIRQSFQNLDNVQGSEVHSNQGVSRESEGSQSVQDLERGLVLECQLPPKPENSRNPDVMKPDGRNHPEGHHAQSLDRGRSEGHASHNADKAQTQGSGGQPPPRTNST